MANIPETLVCRKCSVKKGFVYFKSFEDNLVYGVCNVCSNAQKQQARRLNKNAKTAELANNIISEAVGRIERLYKNHRLTLDLQLILDGISGLINVSAQGHQECQEMGFDKEYAPSFPLSDMTMRQIIWPITMYVYAKTGYNQVNSARILGLSRNTFRKMLGQIATQSPGLVKKYKADQYMPKEPRIKLVDNQDWEEDNFEVEIERIDTPTTLIIHSNIQDKSV